MAHRATKTPSSSHDLDARKATILEAVVAEHIDTALPVGSSSVAHSAEVDVSPATVRSEMVTLEREGYLAQPHTSAGRVPTDKGYRYFVDHLKSGVLSTAQQHQVRDFFSNVRGEVEDVLEQTSTLLSQLTSYTSVVVGPGHFARFDPQRAIGEPRRTSPTPRRRLLRRLGRQAQREHDPRRGIRGRHRGVQAAQRPVDRHHPRIPGPGPLARRRRRDARSRRGESAARPAAHDRGRARVSSAARRRSPSPSTASRRCARSSASSNRNFWSSRSSRTCWSRVSRSPSDRNTASSRSCRAP